MKKIIIILFMLATNITEAQQIISREDNGEFVSLITSTSLLQADPNFCSVNSFAWIPKDTSINNGYGFTFFYSAPEEITSDTNDVVEITFSDGVRFDFNQSRIEKDKTPKDSSVIFSVLISYDCMKKITKVPIREITFITSTYRHTIEINDRMKLAFPNIVNLIINEVEDEYVKVLSSGNGLDATPVVFDSKLNRQLDKKYYGKYSGEWHRDFYLYKFDLFIKPDTSYIVWHIIRDTTEENPKRIKTQVLNIRSLTTEDNTLILDVCYDPNKDEYTNGRRTFYLNLSQNGKVIYGVTQAFGNLWGQFYGIRKKKYSGKRFAFLFRKRG